MEWKKKLKKFAPISLEHLNAQMELMERIDKKYIVMADDLSLILESLTKDYAILTIQGKQYFDYKTMYMDTKKLDSFLAHQDKHDKRRKARSRLYVDSNIAFFECKIKDGMTRKYRYTIDPRDYGVPTAQSQLFVGEIVRSHLHTDITSPLVPELEVLYTRITLCNRKTNERVTIDTNLSFRNPDHNDLFSLPHIAIIEAKTQSDNAHFDRVITDFGYQPMSACSKYCLGMIYTRRVGEWTTFARTISHISFLSLQHQSKQQKQKKERKTNLNIIAQIH